MCCLGNPFYFQKCNSFLTHFLINKSIVYIWYLDLHTNSLNPMNFWQWHHGNEAFPKSHLLFRIGLIGQRQNNPSEARREVMKAHLTGSHWILLDLIGSYCNLKILQQNVNHFFSANRISTSESSLILVTRQRWIRLQRSQASLPPASPCRPKLPCRKGGRTGNRLEIVGWYVAQTHKDIHQAPPYEMRAISHVCKCKEQVPPHPTPATIRNPAPHIV